MNNIIFCPGNHDLTRQDIEERNDCEEIDEKSEIYSDAFSEYNSFIKELGLSNKETYSTHIRTINSGTDTINFLVANTNCFVRNLNSKSAKACINCYRVKDLANSETFSGDQRRNIFVSHLPLDYICECGKHHYRGDDANLCEILFDRFQTFLAGDKHCKSSYSNTFIVGNPLYETESFLLFSSWMNLSNVDFSHQMYLWGLWSNKESSDINYKVANELDKLQLLYQLLRMSDAKSRFSEKRLQDLKNIESKIETPIVKSIKEIIIDHNKLQTLEEFLNEYQTE